MNCEECKENKFEEPVPFRVHERMMARAERTQKRLWITIIILIALLVGSNMAWMYYENSFEDTVTTYESDATDGGVAVANCDGSVNVNGKS